MNPKPRTAAANDRHTIETFLIFGVPVPPEAPAYVHEFTKQVVAIGAKPQPAGVTDTDFRFYLIRAVRDTVVALRLQQNEDVFKAAKSYVLRHRFENKVGR
jgi:hypothetical protein